MNPEGILICFFDVGVKSRVSIKLLAGCQSLKFIFSPTKIWLNVTFWSYLAVHSFANSPVGSLSFTHERDIRSNFLARESQNEKKKLPDEVYVSHIKRLGK